MYEAVWRDRDVFEWRGLSVRAVSVAGLVSMKRLAGRRQDLLDLEQLGFVDEE